MAKKPAFVDSDFAAPAAKKGAKPNPFAKAKAPPFGKKPGAKSSKPAMPAFFGKKK